MIIPFLLISILTRCNQSSVEQDIHVYFDLDSLVKGQANILKTKKVILNKKVVINDKTEIREISTDSLEWLEELELFSLANINKPVNQGMYEVIDRKDVESNLIVRDYTHKVQEEAAVPYMRLWYLQDVSNIRKIQLKFVQDNIVYHSERVLTMELTDIESPGVLQYYSILGYQKLTGMDTTNYIVEGTTIFSSTRKK